MINKTTSVAHTWRLIERGNVIRVCINILLFKSSGYRRSLSVLLKPSVDHIRQVAL
jgi:hypothetical protein